MNYLIKMINIDLRYWHSNRLKTMIQKCMTNTGSAHLAKHTHSEQPIMTKCIHFKFNQWKKNEKKFNIICPHKCKSMLTVFTETTKSLHSWILMSTAQGDLQTWTSWKGRTGCKLLVISLGEKKRRKKKAKEALLCQSMCVRSIWSSVKNHRCTLLWGML